MKHLLTPLTMGRLSLRNRLVMPPMALDIAEEDGQVTPKQLDHYRLRSGQVGLVIVEHTYVQAGRKSHPRQLGIYDDHLLKGLCSLAKTIHREGAAAGIQLTHPGLRGLDKAIGPSKVICEALSRFGGRRTKMPAEIHEMTIKEMALLREDFVQGALRAKKAGFDLVEIHGAHGYLLNVFCSPLTNVRQDEYGGSLTARLRCPLEVLRAVKEAVGNDWPVLYRLGADDRLSGGTTLEDSRQAVPLLEKSGVNALDLSGGLGGYLKEGPEGFFNYLAEGLKPVANVPILVTGGVRSLQAAEDLLSSQTADLIGIGRPLLADPSWVERQLYLRPTI